jgi:hypothetical protein
VPPQQNENRFYSAPVVIANEIDCAIVQIRTEISVPVARNYEIGTRMRLNA